MACCHNHNVKTEDKCWCYWYTSRKKKKLKARRGRQALFCSYKLITIFNFQCTLNITWNILIRSDSISYFMACSVDTWSIISLWNSSWVYSLALLSVWGWLVKADIKMANLCLWRYHVLGLIVHITTLTEPRLLPTNLGYCQLKYQGKVTSLRYICEVMSHLHCELHNC